MSEALLLAQEVRAIMAERDTAKAEIARLNRSLKHALKEGITREAAALRRAAHWRRTAEAAEDEVSRLHGELERAEEKQ